jgi:hypothetical protein
MSEANDKPIKCNDCRFNIDNYCHRNPPHNERYSSPSDSTIFLSSHPWVGNNPGCFAGEPRIEPQMKTCSNCICSEGEDTKFCCCILEKMGLAWYLENREIFGCSIHVWNPAHKRKGT